MDLLWKLLRIEEILLVVPPTHRLAGQERVPLSEVAREAVVIEKVGSGLRNVVETFCRQASFTLSVSYEIDEPAALFEFVKARLGVGFTTGLMEKRVREHNLTSLHLTNPTCQRTFGIAWLRSIISLRQHAPSTSFSWRILPIKSKEHSSCQHRHHCL